jgi:hypothetical protein
MAFVEAPQTLEEVAAVPRLGEPSVPAQRGFGAARHQTFRRAQRLVQPAPSH